MNNREEKQRLKMIVESLSNDTRIFVGQCAGA